MVLAYALQINNLHFSIFCYLSGSVVHGILLFLDAMFYGSLEIDKVFSSVCTFMLYRYMYMLYVCTCSCALS